jgi:hypothetical protein
MYELRGGFCERHAATADRQVHENGTVVVAVAKGRAMLRLRRTVPAVLLVLAFGTTANAAPITFNFIWQVTALSGDYGLLTSGHTVSVGDVLSGEYTFDSAASKVGGGSSAGYTSSGSPHGLRVWGTDWSLSSTPNLFISVYDVPGGDDHIYVTAQHDALPGLTSGLMEILFSSSSDVFSGSDLPLTPPDLAAFSTRRITLDGVSTSSAEGVAIVGQLTSFQAVPEPATLSLLGVGCATLLLRRRTKR